MIFAPGSRRRGRPAIAAPACRSPTTSRFATRSACRKCWRSSPTTACGSSSSSRCSTGSRRASGARNPTLPGATISAPPRNSARCISRSWPTSSTPGTMPGRSTVWPRNSARCATRPPMSARGWPWSSSLSPTSRRRNRAWRWSRRPVRRMAALTSTSGTSCGGVSPTPTLRRCPGTRSHGSRSATPTPRSSARCTRTPFITAGFLARAPSTCPASSAPSAQPAMTAVTASRSSPARSAPCSPAAAAKAAYDATMREFERARQGVAETTIREIENEQGRNSHGRCGRHRPRHDGHVRQGRLVTGARRHR